MTTNSQDFFLPPALIEQALNDFLDLAQRGLDSLEATPPRQRTSEEREMLKGARREVAAYSKALEYWEAGMYPVCLDGIWQIASKSEPGTQHHIWRENLSDGRWRWACDCKQANGPAHVHQAIMHGIERALDLAEAYDVTPEPSAPIDPDTLAIEQLAAGEPPAEYPEDEPPFPTEAPAQLGRRLALARAAAQELWAA